MRTTLLMLVRVDRQKNPIEISLHVYRHFDLLGKFIVKILRCPSVFCRLLLYLLFTVEGFNIQKLVCLVLIHGLSPSFGKRGNL